eukprot:scaffold26875_cov36-Prasinocladus_malaysianus.AAC.1
MTHSGGASLSDTCNPLIASRCITGLQGQAIGLPTSASTLLWTNRCLWLDHRLATTATFDHMGVAGQASVTG